METQNKNQKGEEVMEQKELIEYLDNSKKEFEQMLVDLGKEKEEFEKSQKPSLKSALAEIDEEFIDDLKEDFVEFGEVLQMAAKDGVKLIAEFFDIAKKVVKELTESKKVNK